MYRNACQRGLLTIFYGGGAKPLSIWDTHVRDGYVSRFLDQEIKSMVLEIGGTNISTSYMICPPGKQVLGIAMPFLVMVVRNLKKYFSFEVTILDDSNTRRRFRVSNFQSTTQILPLCTVMPIALSEGWNQIQFNLAEFTRRAYKKQFVEVQKVKINANIRIRRIYFAERLLPEDQLPASYKLYLPVPTKGKKGKEDLKKVEEIAKKEELKVPSAARVVEEPPAAPAAEVVVEEKGGEAATPGEEVSAPTEEVKTGEDEGQPEQQEVAEGAEGEAVESEQANAGEEQVAPEEQQEPETVDQQTEMSEPQGDTPVPETQEESNPADAEPPAEAEAT